MPDTPRHELNSWKEIADYLGVSQRTAQNWEAEQRMPVRRTPGPKGRVSADPDEIDQWKQRRQQERPKREPRLGRRLALYAAGGLAAALLLAWGIRLLVRDGAGVPARYHVEYKTLTVQDEAGRTLWNYRFPDEFDLDAYEDRSFRRAEFARLDGPGSGVSTLFVYEPRSTETSGSTLVCFSESGAVRWQYRATGPVADRKHPHPPIYLVGAFRSWTATPDGPARVVVSSHHVYEHSDELAELDSDGKVLGRYWHSGHLWHIAFLDVDGDGKTEILAGGIDNGYGRATLVALDPDNLAGASTEPEGNVCQLLGLPTGLEKAVVLFPRTCLAGAYNRVTRLLAFPDEVEVDVSELDHDPGAMVKYRFDNRLELKSVRISDRLAAVHHRMELNGTINHTMAQEEKKLVPSIMRKQ